MDYAEKIPAIAGHWRLDVYEGDPIREPLTLRQMAENLEWELDGIRLGSLPENWHRPRIVNRRIKTLEGENTVTTNGKGLLLDRLFSLSGPPTQVNSMGVGNSATASAASDTQLLGSAPAPVLQALDAGTSRSSLVVTCISTFATGTANQTWQELGLFNGTTNGTSTMFNRIAPIGPFTKTSSVSIVVTVTITQS